MCTTAVRLATLRTTSVNFAGCFSLLEGEVHGVMERRDGMEYGCRGVNGATGLYKCGSGRFQGARNRWNRRADRKCMLFSRENVAAS